MAPFVCAAPEQPSNSVAEIQSVLSAQQDAWNRGDIDAFMKGYAQSASTVFVSGDEVSTRLGNSPRPIPDKIFRSREDGNAQFF